MLLDVGKASALGKARQQPSKVKVQTEFEVVRVSMKSQSRSVNSNEF